MQFKISGLLLVLGCLVAVTPALGETYAVTNTNDSGTGSLRWAIECANANPGPDQIAFQILPGSVIRLGTLLWVTDDGTTIDGDINRDGAPDIMLDGSGGARDGLYITSAGNTVRGLAIGRCLRHGIVLSGAGEHDNTIERCYVGTDLTGKNPLGNGSPAYDYTSGIYLAEGVTHNVVRGNVVCGQTANLVGYGILCSEGSSFNELTHNWLGTNQEGCSGLGNAGDGVKLHCSEGNTVADNVICGNTRHGLFIQSSLGRPATGNKVMRNFIGVTPTGAPLANGSPAVAVWADADGDSVSGTVIEDNNISHNSSYGIFLPGGAQVTIRNNQLVGNGLHGVWIGNANQVTIEGNTASHNVGGGIWCGEGAVGVLTGEKVHDNGGRASR